MKAESVISGKLAMLKLDKVSRSCYRLQYLVISSSRCDTVQRRAIGGFNSAR